MVCNATTSALYYLLFLLLLLLILLLALLPSAIRCLWMWNQVKCFDLEKKSAKKVKIRKTYTKNIRKGKIEMQYICKSPFNEKIDCNNSNKSYYCCSTLGSNYKELLMMKAADFWCLSFMELQVKCWKYWWSKKAIL